MERYKLVVVGDGACGKTCLLTVLMTGMFPEAYVPTVFHTDVKEIELEEDGKKVELTLWDTAGQESYDKLRPLSYEHTNVVLICFSIDKRESLANVERKWIAEVKHFCRNTPVILVGNKTDLRKDQSTLKKLALLNEVKRIVFVKHPLDN